MKSRELSLRIGTLLRELRKERGLTQRGAADRVGWPQPKLSLLEQGRLDFGALELVLVITNFEPNESLPDFLAAPPAQATPAAEETPVEETP